MTPTDHELADLQAGLDDGMDSSLAMYVMKPVLAKLLAAARELDRLRGLLIEFGQADLAIEALAAAPEDPDDPLLWRYAHAHEAVAAEARKLAQETNDGRK